MKRLIKSTIHLQQRSATGSGPCSCATGSGPCSCATGSASAGSRRSGAFLVIAMICLLLASALLGTLLKMASSSRRQSHVEASSLQAEWLAESALERAAAKLNRDPAYAGETWDVSAEELNTRHGGQVVIQVVPAKASGRKTIKVSAQFPVDQTPSSRRTKQIELALPAPVATSVYQNENQTPAAAEKPPN